MRPRARMIFKIGLTVIIFVAVYMYYALNHLDPTQNAADHPSDGGDTGADSLNHKESEELRMKEAEEAKILLAQKRWAEGIHLAVVACGDRGNETVIMLKSAAVLTHTYLIVHIFTEEDLKPEFRKQLESWPQKFKDKMQYHLYSITYPEDEHFATWKKLFKPCASQRLFFPNDNPIKVIKFTDSFYLDRKFKPVNTTEYPQAIGKRCQLITLSLSTGYTQSILTNVDSLLYVDTDILFVRPLDSIYGFFKKFNSTQMAALSPEHEDKNAGWYNRFARHPYYGELGLNSGVMLMNLTRMRNSTWISSMLEYHQEYKLKIVWGDQDLINIYFHFYPGHLFVYPCEWNFRPDHCMYMSICAGAKKEGASVIHGCRRVMHNDKQPAFKSVYTAFKEFDMSNSIKSQLLPALKENLKKVESTPCGREGHIFLRQLEEFAKLEDETTNAKQERKDGS